MRVRMGFGVGVVGSPDSARGCWWAPGRASAAPGRVRVRVRVKVRVRVRVRLTVRASVRVKVRVRVKG